MLWGHVIAGKQLQLVTDKKKKKKVLSISVMVRSQRFACCFLVHDPFRIKHQIKMLCRCCETRCFNNRYRTCWTFPLRF